MAPQDLTLPGVTQRNRKAAVTMSALFVLAACLIFLFARWYLQDSRAHMLREMGQEMNSQASGKVALLTVWSGTLAGQINVLVTQDMLGMFDRFVPKFVKQYVKLNGTIVDALTQYAKEVDDGSFPGPEHCFGMKEEVLKKLY